MAYKRLLIWVEGSDDSRFFEKIVKPRFRRSYDWVEVREYSSLKEDKVNDFIRSIDSINIKSNIVFDYLLVADIDNPQTCISKKKEWISQKFKNINSSKIIIVIKEIESWYLAGATNPFCRKYKLGRIGNTDNIGKEEFERLIPSDCGSKTNFMIEILKIFSISTAKNSNRSFDYFARKHQIS